MKSRAIILSLLIVPAGAFAQSAAQPAVEPAPPVQVVPPVQVAPKPNPLAPAEPSPFAGGKASTRPAQVESRRNPVISGGGVGYGLRYSPSNPGTVQLSVGSPLPDVRIDLDLENATPGEALKQIFDRAKLSYDLVAPLPEEPKMSLRLRNVPFASALDVVTQSAGVGWTQETMDGKQRIRVGKGLRSTASNVFMMSRGVPILENLPHIGQLFTTRTAMERSTFTCPHCKKQASLLRAREQPKCEKCHRLFQSDWQFCPADGSKRPPSPSDWRYCPHCGKRVEPSATTETTQLFFDAETNRVITRSGKPGQEVLEAIQLGR